MYVFGGKNIHNYAFNELHCHKFGTATASIAQRQ